MKYIIYHNPSCSKSRAALQKLEKEKKEFEVIEYLNAPLNQEEIAALLKKLDMKADALIRKTEAIFKEKFKGEVLSEKDWIAAIEQYPKLMQRPIIVRGRKAVLGRPIENIDNL